MHKTTATRGQTLVVISYKSGNVRTLNADLGTVTAFHS
jgi:hypothetical protein